MAFGASRIMRTHTVVTSILKTPFLFRTAILATGLSLLSDAALADTLGGVICHVMDNIYPPGGTLSLGSLFNGIAYILGAMLMGQGLYLLTKHYDAPHQTPLYQPITRAAAGAGLIGLPGFITWMIKTLFTSTGPGGMHSCGAGPTAAATGGGLDVLVTNLMNNIKDPFVWMLTVISYTVGVFLLIRGLVKAAKHGTDPRAYSLPAILSNLVVGAALVTVGTSLDMMLATVFGGHGVTAGNVASWKFVTTAGASTSFITAITAALTFFQIIGIIGFIRGFLIIKNAIEGGGQATVAQGITHIIGGVLAINIYLWLQILDNTFGTGFL